MEFRIWIENTELQQAIDSFPLKSICQSSTATMGACDNIAVSFLRHAKESGLKGMLLALDNPHKEPTHGWKTWGGHWKKTGSAISHYIAYFPSLQLGVDFAARQFWDDAKVPEIYSLEEIKQLWSEFPFGMDDSRDHEDFEY